MFAATLLEHTIRWSHLSNVHFPFAVRRGQATARSRAAKSSIISGAAGPFPQKAHGSSADRPRPSPALNTTAMSQAEKANMEVEVKLRIPDAASYAAVCAALLPCFRQAHEQENWFFDGAKKELSSRQIVLRVRIYDTDRKAVITLKGKQVLEGGVGTASEDEDAVDPKLARQFLENPAALLAHDSPVIAKLKSQVGDLSGGLVSLGGFHNLRKEFQWRGSLLEIDQTSYPWGTLHELEAETPKPQELKAEIEAMLKEHGIPFSYSTKSKFANLFEKTLE